LGPLGPREAGNIIGKIAAAGSYSFGGGGRGTGALNLAVVGLDRKIWAKILHS
jgi:hypothetical protein